MQATKESRTFITILMIVLLIHILLFWLFLKIKKSNITQPIDTEKLYEKKTVEKPWVKLQSPPTSPVLFKTVPQTTATPLTKPPQKPLSDDQPTTEKQETKQIQPTEHKVSKQTDQNFITQNTPGPSIALPSQKPAREIQKTMPPQEATPDKESAPTPSPQKQPLSTPSKFSFSNLMQGFANHLQEQNASDSYTMRGKKLGKATAEQIRYAQYGSKICNAIHNAFLINKDKKSITFASNDPLVVKIIINKNGSLCNAQIVKTSHSQSIDHTVLTIVRIAAQSFPPLPDFFAMEQCPFVITINNALQVIEHPEQSYWTL